MELIEALEKLTKIENYQYLSEFRIYSFLADYLSYSYRQKRDLEETYYYLEKYHIGLSLVGLSGSWERRIKKLQKIFNKEHKDQKEMDAYSRALYIMVFVMDYEYFKKHHLERAIQQS